MRRHFKSRFLAFNIPHRNQILVSLWPKVLFVMTLWSLMCTPCISPSNLSTLVDNIRFRGAMSKLISDYSQVAISNKVKDNLKMCHSSSWHSEPYHENQNPSEWFCRTIKTWTNNIINRSRASANCWLLCMSYACYILNHISGKSING